jgi:hypothetical protein
MPNVLCSTSEYILLLYFTRQAPDDGPQDSTSILQRCQNHLIVEAIREAHREACSFCGSPASMKPRVCNNNGLVRIPRKLGVFLFCKTLRYDDGLRVIGAITEIAYVETCDD